jgi:hypothetical protein
MRESIPLHLPIKHFEYESRLKESSVFPIAKEIGVGSSAGEQGATGREIVTAHARR